MELAIILAIIFFETGSGGFLTANVAGGVAGGGTAMWRQGAKSAKRRRKKRANVLKKTAIGRWRLRNEARLWGVAGFLGKGVVAGVKAAPSGARQGRQVRKRALSGAAKVARSGRDRIIPAPGKRCTWQSGYRSPIRAVCGKPVEPGHDLCTGHLAESTERGEQPPANADPTPAAPATAYNYVTCPSCGGSGCEFCDDGSDQIGKVPDWVADRGWIPAGKSSAARPDWPGASDQKDDPQTTPTPSGGNDQQEDEVATADGGGAWWRRDDPDLTRCPGCHLRIKPGGKCLCQGNRLDIAHNPQTSGPDSPAGEPQEDEVTTNTSDVAEDKGSGPYVDAWDGEAGGSERLVGAISEIRDRIAKAVEANGRHEVGGAKDVVGKWDAVVDALSAAGEATDSHAQALHQAWDALNERLKAHAADSTTELVGSQ